MINAKLAPEFLWFFYIIDWLSAVGRLERERRGGGNANARGELKLFEPLDDLSGPKAQCVR